MPNDIKSLLYIDSSNLSRRSAHIVNIMEMCNAFSKHGYHTTLIVPGFSENKDTLFNYYGIKFPFTIIQVKIPKILSDKKIPGLSSIFSLLATKFIKKFYSDIVYTRTPWIFFLVSVVYRRRCFFESHQFRFQGRLTTFIYHTLVKSSVKSKKGHIICISTELKKQWQKYGIDYESLYVAHDGVNTDKYHNSLSKKEARIQLGLKTDQAIVVYTGSLISGKGADILVKAANKLPNIFFIIVGGQKPQIQQLKKIVKSSNVAFSGYIPPKQIPVYQAAADILALPNCNGSVIDDVTSPLKLFEYFASKRPVVASGMPSLLEILQDKYNSLISPAGNYNQLSENIKLLLEKPSLSKKIVENAIKDLENFTWDTRVRHLSKLFLDLNTN